MRVPSHDTSAEQHPELHGEYGRAQHRLPGAVGGEVPSTEPPSVEHVDEGPKGWVVAVAVLTTLIIVALGLAALIWWKWRGVTPASWLGYKRQQDFTTEE